MAAQKNIKIGQLCGATREKDHDRDQVKETSCHKYQRRENSLLVSLVSLDLTKKDKGNQTKNGRVGKGGTGADSSGANK
jgi:hypothetical protein